MTAASPLQNNPALRAVKIIVFTLVGTALMIGAVCWAISTKHFVARASSAPGVVVKLNAGGAHPEIRFTTAAGEAVEYPQGGMIWGYRVGDKWKCSTIQRTPPAAPSSTGPARCGALSPWTF